MVVPVEMIPRVVAAGMLACCVAVACGAPAPPAEPPVAIGTPAPQPSASSPPALVVPPRARVLASYERGKNDDEVKRAAQEVIDAVQRGDHVDRATADALWTCFLRYEPSKTNSILGTQLIHDAILAVKDPSYGAKAVAVVTAPVVPTTGRVNDSLQFWQTTAIQLIRELHYAPGAKALVAVLLTKEKLSLSALAAAAMRTIATHAERQLAAALDQSDPDLVKLEAAWGSDTTWVALVLDVLGQTTLDAARDAIVAFLPHIDTDANRAAAASALVYFPTSAPLLATFEKIYASLPPISKKGDTGSERAALLGLAGNFLDATLEPWALREAKSASGSFALEAKVRAIQSAISLMGPREKPGVAQAIADVERTAMPAAEKKDVVGRLRAMFQHASAALDACAQNPACYVKLLEQPIPVATDAANWKAIKAAHMAGMLGNAATREGLVVELPNVKDMATRQAVALAINHLAPRGDAADADALDRIVADDKARRDVDAMRGDEAVSRVASMLRARATP